jgi:hypothetical protein
VHPLPVVVEVVRRAERLRLELPVAVGVEPGLLVPAGGAGLRPALIGTSLREEIVPIPGRDLPETDKRVVDVLGLHPEIIGVLTIQLQSLELYRVRPPIEIRTSLRHITWGMRPRGPTVPKPIAIIKVPRINLPSPLQPTEVLPIRSEAIRTSFHTSITCGVPAESVRAVACSIYEEGIRGAGETFTGLRPGTF